MTAERSEASQTALPTERDGSKDLGDAHWRSVLSARQFSILREKDTERMRSGEYDLLFAPGKYLCAGCRSLLYTSEMKFDCGCGWPGFWTCVPKAVREELEPEGWGVEILCNACNGHLGHVFRGEGFSNPPPNERHCVNSLSLVFEPAAVAEGGSLSCAAAS